MLAELLLSCYRAARSTMNVTLKLPDELIKAAKHRAIDEDTSLSAWVADLVRRELGNTSKPELEETLCVLEDTDTEYGNRDLPLPNRKEPCRKIEFP